jgi:3-oxoacyl-[acyl-carrier-protein] synthase-3
MMRSVMLGCGSYLPSQVLTNEELARKVDTTDEWIVQRTGIHERRIAAAGEMTSHMAVRAAQAALAHAHVDAQSIDLIVLATSTPDNTFPATAVAVQADLGINHGAAFDLQAVCSGFVYALATADALLRSGSFARALVIGAETFSRILDWTDRGTCVLFGDGAGAVVLEAQSQPGTREDRGILTTRLRSDGRHKMKLYVDGGPSSTGTVGHLRMEGREVFRHAVAMITDVVEDAFKATGYTAADVDWFIRTKPISALSTARPTSSAFRRPKSLSQWTVTAILRLPRSRWRWPMRLRIGALNAGICCCSKRWAAASPGAPLWCAGKA